MRKIIIVLVAVAVVATLWFAFGNQKPKQPEIKEYPDQETRAFFEDKKDKISSIVLTLSENQKIDVDKARFEAYREALTLASLPVNPENPEWGPPQGVVYAITVKFNDGTPQWKHGFTPISWAAFSPAFVDLFNEDAEPHDFRIEY